MPKACARCPAPRIFLGARRLKLLRRERERQSLRWNQFHLLMAGKAPCPSRGSPRLCIIRCPAAPKPAAARRLGAGLRRRSAPTGAGLRLVPGYSHRGAIQNPGRQARAGIQQSRRDSSVSAVRSRLLAAVALSGHLPDVAGTGDRTGGAQVVGRRDPARHQRRPRGAARDDTYALMEILHVVRDNFNQDLREAAPQFFTICPWCSF
jgi:hypothetical protein